MSYRLDEEIARAFNRGSDDRIAGIPMRSKKKFRHMATRRAYRNGWFHAHEEWCAELPEGLRRPLPPAVVRA